MANEDLPEHVRRAAEAAHRNWRIGDDGEGRLHAALVVAASLIRVDERERLGVIPLSETLTDEQVAEFRERFEAAMANPGLPRVLPSDGWLERAEAAEAKLAEVRETIAAFFTHHGNSAAFALQSARDLAEGIRQVLDRAALESLSAVCTGPDCGEQFADSETSEYLFATRERMERLLYADGWAADPVLCPACQQEAGHDPLA